MAYRTEKITRRVCRAVCPRWPSSTRSGWAARSFGGPKYTVSPIYEGMLKEEMDAAARRHPNVRYDPS